MERNLRLSRKIVNHLFREGIVKISIVIDKGVIYNAFVVFS
jgi:hypothetical protein